MKRLFSFFLAVIIGWGSVTQSAKAFAPVAVLGAPQFATAGGVSYALGAIAGVIGVRGLYMTIKDASDNAIAIPLGDKPDNQPPAPSAPAVVAPTITSGGLPSNSSTVQAVWEDQDQYACAATGGWCPGTITSLDVCLSQYQGGFAIRRCRIVTPGDPNVGKSYGQNCAGCQTSTPTSECQAGYSVNGSSCALTNPRQATDDKRCDILLSNGQFSTSSDMNCPATVDGSKLAPMIREGKVIAYGTNSSGQPLMWEVSQTGGSIQIKEHTQIQTPTQTQVKTTTVSVDAETSAITQVQTQTSPGSLSSPAAQTVPQTTSDPTTSTNTPTVEKDQTKPADLQTCGLPGSPACSVNDDGFEGKDNFSGPKSQEISDKLEQNKTQLENLRNSVPDIAANWIPSLMPGAASACSPLTFDFSVNNPVLGMLSAPNVKLDICEHLELVRSILGYMLGLYTVWYVWRRFTTANQGA